MEKGWEVQHYTTFLLPLLRYHLSHFHRSIFFVFFFFVFSYFLLYFTAFSFSSLDFIHIAMTNFMLVYNLGHLPLKHYKRAKTVFVRFKSTAS